MSPLPRTTNPTVARWCRDMKINMISSLFVEVAWFDCFIGFV